MKSRLILIAMICMGSLVLVQCKSPKEAEAEKLKSEVLQKHDSLMIKMDKLMALRKKLLDHRKLHLTKPQRDKLNASLELLTISQRYMMDWMSDTFKIPTSDTPVDEVIKYFQEQRDILIDMDGDMDYSMETAIPLIEKFDRIKAEEDAENSK